MPDHDFNSLTAWNICCEIYGTLQNLWLIMKKWNGNKTINSISSSISRCICCLAHLRDILCGIVRLCVRYAKKTMAVKRSRPNECERPMVVSCGSIEPIRKHLMIWPMMIKCAKHWHFFYILHAVGLLLLLLLSLCVCVFKLTHVVR